jgi:hypothetical protein|tara:strand:- start:6838 stop:7305 length:468 start_codon:yes stop_codon:yes gene_type:complete
MFMDERLEFCDAVSAAIEASTANIGDVIDLGVARDVGQGQPMYLVIQISAAFDGGAGTAGTTAFQLVSDSSSTPSTDGSQTIHFTTDVFAAAAQLTLGTTMVYPLPMHDTGPGFGYERYLGLQQVQAAEGEDDGAINAFLTFDPHGWTSHADASN